MLVKEAERKEWPLQVLDPQMLALGVVRRDEDGRICNHVATVMSNSAKSKKEFIMFACNTGGHCIVVEISVKWGIVWYLDSNEQSTYDVDILKTMLSN